MKKSLILILMISLVLSCKNNPKKNTKEIVKKNVEYLSFGEKINNDNVISFSEMKNKYDNMKNNDTISVKMSAKINSVCAKKGCWMKLDLGNNNEAMVRFKDYGFFMPLNATGDVIVEGKAYITEISVSELKHYAEDAGKTKEEIEKITESKITYAFEATGALLEK
ncbi:MAG: DUF4920 domain-containing protein [Flavobacteriaceae bacterium]|nr:DUF4920 domain-containing protein [Flavobacteriaceae bacterium]